MTTRPFRFGLQAFAADSAIEWKDLARKAEDLGFSTLFTCDHYFGPGSVSDESAHRPVDLAPMTPLAVAAAVTPAHAGVSATSIRSSALAAVTRPIARRHRSTRAALTTSR